MAVEAGRNQAGAGAGGNAELGLFWEQAGTPWRAMIEMPNLTLELLT